MSIHIGFIPPFSGGYGLKPIFSSVAAECGRQRKEQVHFQFLEGSSERVCDAYLFALNPILSDIREAKRMVADLLLKGVSKSKMLGVLLDEGARGALPLPLVSEELSFETVSLAIDREFLVSMENRGDETLSVPLPSRMANSIQKLFKRVEQLLESGWVEEESVSSNINLREFEEKVSSRLWAVLMKMDSQLTDVDFSVRSAVDREIQSTLIENSPFALTPELAEALRNRLLNQLVGWGPLQKLMDDPEVSEVMVNGPRQIFVEREGRVQKLDHEFMNEAQLRVIIERMAAAVGRRVDTSSPLCDVRLPNGCRVNIVLPPLALNGPIVTLRRFRPAFREAIDLIREGSITEAQSDILMRAVQAKENILIAGSSSSGKTTLLNILSGFIGREERIITLEDAAELDLPNPHVVRLETRKKNSEGVGEITMSDLVVNALRMRPDRLIVGECRGVEAIPMLQAMNTGHDGSMTTLHANSAPDAIHRLESMVLLGAPHWPPLVIRQQIASAVDLIVYLKRVGSERRCEEISRLQLTGSEVSLQPVAESSS